MNATISMLASALYLAIFVACRVQSFVVTGHPPSAMLTRTRTSSSAGAAAVPSTPALAPVVAKQFGDVVKTPRAPALRMSQYEGGAASGGGETRMEMQELIVDFTDDGRILLEVKGVKGQECRQITEELIKALGDVIQTENTAEYFEERVTNVNKGANVVQVGWSYDTKNPEW